jgi:hypothetical protein
MPSITGDSDTNTAAVSATNTNGGTGAFGKSRAGEGVHGETDSDTFAGVAGINNGSSAPGKNPSGVFGKSHAGEGVHGETDSDTFAGVAGINNGPSAPGKNPCGVFGKSRVGEGVHGETDSDTFAGVAGINNGPSAAGSNPSGVFGKSHAGEGVHGETDSSVFAAVAGISRNTQSDAPAIFGKGRVAGFFEGNVIVTGDVQLTGADCAEDFDAIDPDAAEPGTVVVFVESGAVAVSDRPYDSRVAGVVSGAGGYKPAVIFDRHGRAMGRRPLALIGKVYCKVDAGYNPVTAGDMLTTSATPGYAMKATDPTRAFGSIIGKALSALPTGRGLVPILVSLQ